MKFIYKHIEARDGILVWIDLCNTQDNDGNVSECIVKNQLGNE